MITIASFIAKIVLLNSILTNVYAQPHEQSTPPQTVQRICSQCHALEVMGNCLAGDCSNPRAVRVAKAKPWNMVLDRMIGKDASISDSERQEIVTYLQASYPAKTYPLTWKKVGDFEKGGWNVINLREHAGFLYAGFEGNGKIMRTADSINWQEVLDTDHYTIYGITPFKNTLYAGAAEPDPQIWSSTDGLKWRRKATLPAADVGVFSVGVFKNQLYVGTGRGWIYRSTNGKQWKKVAALKGDVPAMFSHWSRFLIPYKGYLYAGFEEGPLYRSADGLIWTRANLNIGDNNGLRGATLFKGVLYVGTTGDGTIWRTENGHAWSRAFKSPNDTPGYVAAMAVAGDYLFASIGGYIFRTADGLGWEEVGHISSTSIESMAGWRGNIYAGISTAPAGFIYQAYPAQKLTIP